VPISASSSPVARTIGGSAAPFADGVDFLEHASVNFLIAVALGWSLKSRTRFSMVLPARRIGR